MDSFLLVILLLCLKSVESTLNAEVVCFYVEDNESTQVYFKEKHCTNSLSAVIRTLNTSSSVSNFSNVVIDIETSIVLNETMEFENFQESSELKIDGKGNEITCTNIESSGLYFRNVKNLQLMNITLRHCGTLQESTSEDTDSLTSTVKFKSSIYIINCTNVTLHVLTVTNSSGTGVTFFDTFGKVTVTNSMFIGNMVETGNPHPGGSGVYIEFTYCAPGIYRTCANRSKLNQVSTEYSLRHCVFHSNSAEALHPNRTSYVLGTKSTFQGFGRGGGLAIIFKGYHGDIKMGIYYCEFHNNTAYWGGGLYIMFRDRSNNNMVTVEHTKFVKNYVKMNGGGGVKAGFLSYNSLDSFSEVKDNSIIMFNCTFESNMAEQYGGGTAIVASKGLHRNKFEFINCMWTKNQALAASAVDLSPGVWSILGDGILPSTTFTDCSFTQNNIKPIYKDLGPGIRQETKGKGTFLATQFVFKFNGITEFINNMGTALYLTSATVSFEQKSNLLFRENTGKKGGAIALIAFSVLYIEDNVQVVLESNTALRSGGAIYTFSVETHLSSRSCFIQYKGITPNDKRNITISFKNNTAISHIGHTLYTTSLSPCQQHCKTGGWVKQHNESTFDCVGAMNFIDSSFTRPNNIVTQKGSVRYDKSDNEAMRLHYGLTPGKSFHPPINTLDELHQSQSRAFDIIFMPQTNILSQSLTTHRKSNNKINLSGVAGVMESGTLTYENYDLSVSINVTILNCPPGYALNDTKGECHCVQSHYKGLRRCDNSIMQAYILHGYWIGECGHEICTAHCPVGFCSYNDNSGSAIEYLLPPDRSGLESYVCGTTRRGILCTMCNHNLSVYFHSIFYSCRENTNCKYGIPLYIVSELLPLLLIFTIIIAFDISFTSGYLNGFILYAQILDSLVDTARGTVQYTHKTKILTSIYQLIYHPLNLDFFDSFETLSFCIWEGAEVMDVLAMKYVTILCALILVLMTIFLWNTRLCAKLSNNSCCRHRTIKNAVIHGLSAFLVMCYSQCARVSFEILGLSVLYGFDNKQLNVVALRAGDQKYFHGRHLRYAIPAATFLMTLVALPPILLLAYPLIFNVLSKCNLSEFKPVLLLSRLIPMQLLDSFQSCFKDSYRYFAGLYFLYRSLILATSTFSPSPFHIYVIIELELILILCLHSVVQPYKKTTHNQMDSLIFANLAIINGLSLINFYISRQQNVSGNSDIASNTLQSSIYIQLFLIYLPSLCVLAYLLTKLVSYIYGKCKKLSVFKRDRSWESLNSTELPSLRDTDYTPRALTKELNYYAFANKEENGSSS